MLRHDVQDIGDVMEYTREQMLTIVTFLDEFGIGSFVNGFRDGLHDYRDELDGVDTRIPDPEDRPIALSCYKAGVDAARKCLKAWLAAHADTQDDLANIRDFRKNLELLLDGSLIWD